MSKETSYGRKNLINLSLRKDSNIQWRI